MRINKLKRFVQEHAQCSVAACSCISHFYNKNISYEYVQSVAQEVDPQVLKGGGLDTSEIGVLLNKLGFRDVTLVSADLDYLDFSWRNSSKSALIKNLSKSARKSSFSYRDMCKRMASFLSRKPYRNNLVIDYSFGEYIRGYIDAKTPVLVTFNWSKLFKIPKYKGDNIDPIFGEPEYHVTVIYGYDDQGVFILDSHEEFYKYRLKKFRKGRYLVPWEELMVVMSSGDVVIPENYDKEYMEYELV